MEPWSARIVGWSHSAFGRLDGEDVESLSVRAVRDALHDAGVGAHDIDEIFVGHFNAGFSAQSFTASLALQADDGLRFTPATRVENACATGSAAVHQALRSIESGRAQLALVLGVEKMTDTAGPQVGANLLRASYLKEEGETPGGFAGVFGRIAERYFERYGDQSEALARIAAKNHANGAANPLAQLRKDLGYEFCRTVSEKNPFVAGPLKRTDCSPVSDGAAALVVAHPDVAAGFAKAVGFRAAEHVQDYLPMSRRDIVAFEGAPGAMRSSGPRSGSTTCRSSRHTTASRSPS
jgi:acetyl-CoA C-acetyltransferase